MYEKVGCDFLCLPNPVARCIDFPLKMQHLLIIRQRRPLHQNNSIMRITSSDVFCRMLDILLEQPKLLILALRAQRARPDDILQFQPIPPPPRLLLFHLI